MQVFFPLTTNKNLQKPQYSSYIKENNSSIYNAEKFSYSVNPKFYQVYFMGKLSPAEKLPKNLQMLRKQYIEDAVEYVASQDFYKSKIQHKNIKNKRYIGKMNAILQDPEALRERAEVLLNKSYRNLKQLYKGKSEVMLPWSGGRDSSALFACSMVFFPNINYKLVTVLNGLAKEIHNPMIQYKRLMELFNSKSNPINISHVYLDSVSEIKRHVIDTAIQDKNILGSSALCSGCKMVMEKGLTNYAKESGIEDIVMAYTKYQGIQDWIEQTPVQINFMQEQLQKKGVKSHSPLYEVLEYPFDSPLLLSSLGVPLSKHKIEMKCSAGGLNPQNLDSKKLIAFLTLKNSEIDNTLRNAPTVVSESKAINGKYQTLIPYVQRLRNNENFIEGVFKEEKFSGQYGKINT